MCVHSNQEAWGLPTTVLHPRVWGQYGISPEKEWLFLP